MLKKLEKFSLPELEKKILEFWKSDDTFTKSLQKTRRGKPFVFFEGPPTANGRPGIHHVLSRSFKDVILRYKTMRGYYVLRRAGWDTHGLPVEIEVEKKLGIKNKTEIEKFGIAEFNEQAKQSVWKYKSEWEHLTHRMGFWLDIANPYITYENNYIESLWQILQKISHRGFLKKFYKIVPYCPRCQTPLSSHELAQPGAYKKTKDPSLYVKFPLIGEKHTSLLVWTTTPWTLPANVAVAVNPALTYTKFRVGSEYVWAYNPPPNVVGKNAEAVEKISGKKLIGLKYKPLFALPANYQMPTVDYYKVLGADFVSVEEGTGLVHIAPAFGEDDLQLVKQEYPEITAESIPLTIDNEGKMAQGFPGNGEFIKKADGKVIADLEARNLVYLSESIEHEYPFCWRCSAPLIYFARESWFVEMSKLRKELMQANQKINWIPEHVKDGRFGEWLKEIKDWAISRERYWGTPLPVWECESCSEHRVIGSVDELNRHAYFKNKFLFVRHTEADHTVSGRIASGPERGRYISHLTEKGIRDAEKLATRLKREKIGTIFTSPYARTREMAEIIARKLRVPVVVSEHLSEVNTGIFNWRPVYEYHQFFEKPAEKFVKAPPGGESLNEVKKRMARFLEEVHQMHSEKTILVIGHGYPLWMLEAVLRNATNEEALHFGDPELGEIRKAGYENVPRDKNGNMDLHRPYIDGIVLRCAKCGDKMRRVKEVVDVWFDSGAMPFAQWHYPFENKKLIDGQPRRSAKAEVGAPTKASGFPANYIAEGIDQTRGWFYTLLAISLLLKRGIPYHNVIALGLVLDRNGQKMSKSKGNVVDPGLMFEQYGADVLRWYFYTVNAPGDAKKFDEADLKKISNKVFSILYNSFVFYDTYADKNSKLKTKNSKLPNVLDRWVLARLHQTIANATFKIEAYEIGEAARHIEEFIDDVSRWYIRRSRRRLQKQEAEAKQDYLDASNTLRSVLESISMLIAPFAPFFADALYQAMGNDGSVHLMGWPKAEKKLIDEKLIRRMSEVRILASQALALRANLGVKVRQPLQKLKIKNQKSKIDTELTEILKDEVNVKEVIVDPQSKEELEFDMHITPELHAEGILRELIRSIQDLRQDAKLKPKDRIEVFVETGDQALKNILSSHHEMLKKEVGAASILLKKGGKIFAHADAKIDNTDVWMGINKVK